MTNQNNRPYVRVDTRRRVTLPKTAAEPGQMFLIDVSDDGIIRLTRGVAVPLDADGRPDIGSLRITD